MKNGFQKYDHQNKFFKNMLVKKSQIFKNDS